MKKQGYKSKNNNMPITNFRYGVEIDGLYEGGFSKVSGMASEIEVEEYIEGGVNHFVHRMPVRVRNYNIILEKGITQSKVLYKWFTQVKDGVINKLDFSIILYDTKGEVVRRWSFKNGYPVRWEASDLDALDNSILVERIELAHEGMVEND